MATFDLSATFGASFTNSDTVLLSVSSGTISPLSTTKGDLAAGITVTCNAGVTITAEITSGTCDGVTDTVVAQAVTPTPTPTGATPTPTATGTPTPTPTATPPVFSFAVTAYDSVENDVCNTAVTTTVYTQDFTSFSNITSGDRIYSDSGLTTEIYGGNNFYGMNDGLSGNSIYTFRYSTGYGVDQTGTCPTVTPTPTPATPTPTPTPLPFNFSITPYDSVSGNVCGVPLSQSVYTRDFDSFANITSGDRVYSDQALTTEIYGGNNYYGMNDTTTGNSIYYFRYSTGYGIDQAANCFTPTPTPTPTGTPTPTPTPSSAIDSYGYSVQAMGSGDANINCGGTTSGTQQMWFERSFPYSNLQVGDTAFRASNGIVPWVGGSTWYGISPNTVDTPGYNLKISDTGEILEIYDCNNPTATPVPTPTPTPTQPGVRVYTNRPEQQGLTATELQNGTSICDIDITRTSAQYLMYTNGKTTNQVNIGDRIWLDVTITSFFRGNGLWYGIADSDSVYPIDESEGRAWQIDDNGYVINIALCTSGNVPTPTPTTTTEPTHYEWYITVDSYNLASSACLNTVQQIVYTSVSSLSVGTIVYTDAALTNELVGEVGQFIYGYATTNNVTATNTMAINTSGTGAITALTTC